MSFLLEGQRPPRVIHVTSEKDVKSGPARRASEALRLKSRVLPSGVTSSFEDQPGNVQRGVDGARSRTDIFMKGLSRRLADIGLPTDPSDVVIAIENFADTFHIKEFGSHSYDMAAVLATAMDGRRKLAFSAGMEFPTQFLLDAQGKGLADDTWGKAMKRHYARQRVDIDDGDPHKILTGIPRSEFIYPPLYMLLMQDKDKGRELEKAIRKSIAETRIRIPKNAGRFISTSKDTLVKNAAIKSSLENAGVRRPNVEEFDGTSEEDPAQITDLPTCFRVAYNRMQKVKTLTNVGPNDILFSIQSCACPVVLSLTDLRVVDFAVVLIQIEGKIYSSISMGTEFPEEAVKEASARGFNHVTIGQMIAQKYGSDAANPQDKLYGLSRQVLLEDAICKAFARRQHDN